MEKEARVEISLENRFKEALRKAKEVREHIRDYEGEPSVAECLAYDMQYVEEYVKQLEVEKEQYKNDYFNLYEQNKQYIHYSKIEELAKKIHNDLDKNGITRAYQIIIDGYFDEVLGG